MPKMRDVEHVDAGYVDAGPNRTTMTQRVPVSADVLFKCLADGGAWKEWFDIDVEWTSSEPRGPGTTRDIRMNGLSFEEYFFVWDEGVEMAFRFDRASLPFIAFAERYRCEPRGESSADLVWTYNFEWRGPLAPVAGRLFKAGFNRTARHSFGKLATLLADESHRWTL